MRHRLKARAAQSDSAPGSRTEEMIVFRAVCRVKAHLHMLEWKNRNVFKRAVSKETARFYFDNPVKRKDAACFPD